MKKLAILLVFCTGCLFAGCEGSKGSGSDLSTSPVLAVQANYSTSITPVASKSVAASTGGEVTVASGSSLLDGIKLSIPGGALGNDIVVTVGEVNAPPALPLGLNFVGVPIDFGPDGTTFSTPATVEIPFTDATLNQAGVTSKVNLKLYTFDKATGVWSEVKIISIDTVRNIVIGQVNHFSFYSLVGLSGMPPEDLGRPQMGDILFTLGTFDNGKTSGWIPGHDGIYTGEKTWNGKGLASADVVRCGKYNTVEALWGGVQYSYYKIPNTVQSCEVQTLFSGDAVYMGAREPKDFLMTFEQRINVVAFVEAQVGRPYAIGQSIGALFGMLDGVNVKGPSFNCVGLAEKAYEIAGANIDDQGIAQGIVEHDDGDLLTPALMYRNTKPAGGEDAVPVIVWATLTPDSGMFFTPLLAQIAVSHPYGLGYIDSVIYATDDGYVNPNMNINDAGVDGDIQAGDGIYSAQGPAGGDPSKGNMGLTFVVTDKAGKSTSVRIVYAYIRPPMYTEVAPKQVSRQLSGRLKVWIR